MSSFASRFSGVAMLALAALPTFALVASAHAAEPAARIAVGNLNNPTQAARFDADVRAEADRVCTDMEKAPGDGSKVVVSHASCTAAFRSEVLAQLSSHGRNAVEVASAASSVQVAGR